MKSDSVKAVEEEIDELVKQLARKMKALDLLSGEVKERKTRKPYEKRTSKDAVEEKLDMKKINEENVWPPKTMKKSKAVVNPPVEDSAT